MGTAENDYINHGDKLRSQEGGFFIAALQFHMISQLIDLCQERINSFSDHYFSFN